ncbi:MAG TPA: hypothetical protein ENK54_04600 [Thiotrichales bacterium]|nr:hypothetical protein [Thiotrichales bacterium]
MRTPTHTTVSELFFAPVRRALEEASHRRCCRGFSDESYLFAGIMRVIDQAQSGRDWVQQLQSVFRMPVTVASFFKALRSPRREALVSQVAQNIRHQVDQDCDPSSDPLAENPELDGYDVYASDGHYEKAACHTKPIGGKVYPPGYFFSLNLRSHSSSLLDVARPKAKREHDMAALKRLSANQLRLGAPQGRKVIHVYDPAGIDYRQWYNWKTKGIYFISREKANSRAQVIGLRQFDSSDPRNTGILADEHLGVSSGVLIRRVKYQDPASGTVFSFITNESTLPPGLIAFLYKLRWDIEKCFDEKKNKFQERKAWATTDQARSQQALFICMAHNLLLLLERKLDREEQIQDEKLLAKQRRRLQELERTIRNSGRTPNPLVQNCTRITQRSLQFIRWVRNALRATTPWYAALAQLKPLMTAYLQ